MLDIKQLEPQKLQENLKKRGITFDIDAFTLALQRKNALINEQQNLQEESNKIAKSIKTARSSEERQVLIERGKELKLHLQELKSKVKASQEAFEAMAGDLPNWTHPQVPIGGEDDFRVLKTHLEPSSFSFPPKDHLELMQLHDLLDFERAAHVTGSKFYYLKNEAVWLEQALILYALNLAHRHGFKAFSSPDLAKTSILEGTGYSPKGPESQIYKIQGHDLNLIGTAEITLGGYWADQILSVEDLPIRMVGLSHCFRTEAGSHGSHSKGLYRVHQFTKVELFVICPEEVSESEHENLLRIEEELFQGLKIPYRVIDVASGDLGAPASRKFDIEAWMPGRDGGSYGEVTSASNCLEFQARRLKMRVKDGIGKTKFVHTLNGTALAMPRAIISIIENGQKEDGSIEMPEVLRPYLPFSRIEKS